MPFFLTFIVRAGWTRCAVNFVKFYTLIVYYLGEEKGSKEI